MYVNNGVVEIICTIIMSMEKSLENYYHELFLTTLNQLLQVSPSKVKEICSKFGELKETLLSLQRIYDDDTNFQVNTIYFLNVYKLNGIKENLHITVSF